MRQWLDTGPLVGMDYVAKYTPVMEGRLVEAATMLAQVLNRVGAVDDGCKQSSAFAIAEGMNQNVN